MFVLSISAETDVLSQFNQQTYFLAPLILLSYIVCMICVVVIYYITFLEEMHKCHTNPEPQEGNA